MKNFIKNILVMLVLVCIIFVISKFIVIPTIRWINNQGPVTVNTKSTLERSLEIKELQTIECVYNSYVIAYKNDFNITNEINENVTDDENYSINSNKNKESERQYAISYRGIVKAGINESPTVTIQEDTVYVDIPDAKILECHVDPDEKTMKFMYMKSKYKKKANLQKNLQLCEEDLKLKVSQNTDILELANQNAKEVIKALCMPFKMKGLYNFVIEGETL